MENTKLNKNNICPKPFENIEIHKDGSVYTCCPFWNNNYSIGNIFYDSVENIWNSEKVIEFRKKILNHDYSLCNKECCFDIANGIFSSAYDTVYEPVMKEYPKKINLCYDYECNSACIFCRDKVLTLPEQKLYELNSKIDSVYIPLLKDAKVVTISTAGESFFSRHSRLLIKRIIEEIPDIKFEFYTNGILDPKKVFNELNITSDKIESISVSIHSATKETYGKIVKDGEKKFDIIIKHIEYLSSLKKNDDFLMHLNFVVTSLNYQDLPAFIKLAIKYKAYPVIWEYRPEQNNCKNVWDEILSITQNTHPKHKDLVRVLKTPILIACRNHLAPILQHIQDENL